MDIRQEITNLLERLDKNENIHSAFVLISGSEHTAFLAGGDKDDLNNELAKAFAVLIKEDPKVILSFARAIEDVRGGKEKENQTSAEDIVKEALSKVTKH